jgi:hypothetical protein
MFLVVENQEPEQGPQAELLREVVAEQRTSSWIPHVEIPSPQKRKINQGMERVTPMLVAPKRVLVERKDFFTLICFRLANLTALNTSM